MVRLSAAMAQLDSHPKEEFAKLQQVGQNTPETLLTSIPIVDFAGIDGPEHTRICQQIAEACETWGFFHLINHGVDQSLLKRAKEVSWEFFHGPEEEKSKIKVQVLEGWNHSKNLVEGNNMIQKDTVEHMYVVCHPERPNSDRIPQQPRSYRPTILEYTKRLKFLGEKLLIILSEMLGLAPEALQTAMIRGTASQCVQISLRSNFYGMNENGEALPNLCHAHSDPGYLTFLLADEAPGLEIRKDGHWVKVDPIPGGLIVNVADTLEVCSNGRYKSIYHRGLPCGKQERLSLANFQMPEMDAVIGPIPSLMNESHPPLYRTFQFGEYVLAAIERGLDDTPGLQSFKL